LANDGNRLGRGDVISRTPVLFARDTVQVFFDYLLCHDSL
jgi:hypothetical protein